MQVLLGEDFKRALKTTPKKTAEKLRNLSHTSNRTAYQGYPAGTNPATTYRQTILNGWKKSDLPNGTTFGTITSAFPNTTAAGMAI